MDPTLTPTPPAATPHQRFSVAAPLWLKALLVLLLLCQAAACIAGRGPALAGNVDFRVYYSTGEIVRTDQAAQLYDYAYQTRIQNERVGQRSAALPFLYPPFASIAFVPFSLLQYRAAFFAFALVNGLLLVASVLILRRNLQRLHPYPLWFLVLLSLCLFPVAIAFMQGQVSFLLLLICCSAWAALRHRQDGLAGILLSLLLIKFQMAIPIFLLFLIWRKWRTCAGFLAGAVVLASLSWLVAGSVGIAAYLRSLATVSTMTAANAAAAKSKYGMFPTDMPNLHGLLFGLTHGASAGLILCLVFSLGVLLFAATRRPSLPTALVAAMLVSYHMQPHDLLLLLLPLSVLADRNFGRKNIRVEGRPWSSHPSLRWAVILIPLTFPIFPILMMTGKTYFLSLAVLGLFLELCLFMKQQHVEGINRRVTPRFKHAIVVTEQQPIIIFHDQIG